MPRLLAAGWELEQAGPTRVVRLGRRPPRPGATGLPTSSWRTIAERYADVVSKVRDLGVAFSDRRAVKVLKLVAASAVLCGRAGGPRLRLLGAPLRLGP